MTSLFSFLRRHPWRWVPALHPCKSFSELRHLQETTQIVPPSRSVPGLPSDLDGLVMRLLEHAVEDRLGYAEDIISILTTIAPEAVDVKTGKQNPENIVVVGPVQ